MEPLFLSHCYSPDYLAGTSKSGEMSPDSKDSPHLSTAHSKRRRRRLDDADVVDRPGDEVQESQQVLDEGSSDRPVYYQNDLSDEQFLSLQSRIRNRPYSAVIGSYDMHVARPMASMKGHTAFLTFASRPAE